MHRFRTILSLPLKVAVAGWLLSAAPAFAAPLAQNALQPIALSTAEDELLRMAGQAGVIFAGEVLRVTPQSGSVEIAFHIDQAILGCSGDSTYTLREWAGLWTGGHQRYAPGQHLLILLHAPSASGLSSPVGGQDGIIPLIGVAPAPKPADATIAQAEPVVDLRWIQARLPRATPTLNGTRVHSFAAASSAYVGRELAPLTTRKASLPSAGWNAEPGAAESGTTLPLASAASRGITLRSILAILGAWQAQQNHASQ